MSPAKAQTFIAAASSASTRLTTKTPVSRMLRVVSLKVPSAWCGRPRTTSAGSSLKTLKTLSGAAFTTPVAPRVENSAIGRGTTSALDSL